MIEKVYEALNTSPIIQEKVSDRIKFYEYPPTDEMEGVYIVIDPVGPPVLKDYGDNEPLTYEYLFQIEVWSLSLEDRKTVANEIPKILRKELGMAQNGVGPDEWDKETGIYRDARRYVGKEEVQQ